MSSSSASEPPPSSSSGSSPAQTTPSVSNTPSSSSSSSPSSSPASSNTPSSTPANSVTTTPNSGSTATQATSAAAEPTSAQGGTSAASPTSTTAQPQTTFSSTYTSDVQTTVFSTAPGGSVTFFTTTIPEVFTTAVSTNVPTPTTNNTGLIVGAVVGGVAGIIALVLLLFCIRKRVNKDDFDGNFDPDRVIGHAPTGGGTLPHVDLADEVSPFQQTYSDPSNASMRQYGKSPYVPSLPTSGHPSTDFYQPGAMGAGMSTVDAQPGRFIPGAGPPPPGAYAPPISMYGTGSADWHSPRPGFSPPPSTTSGTTSSTRATKEREAAGRSGQGTGLGLATQQETPEGSGDVVVHQDAGRAPPAEEQAPPREIPPSYDSIRQD